MKCKPTLGPSFQQAIESILVKVQHENWIPRLWNKDASLWSTDPQTQQKIAHRLGWMDILGLRDSFENEILSFHQKRLSKNFSDMILLGMGGSSLAGEVFASMTQQRDLSFHMLDTSDEDRIRRTFDLVDASKVLILVGTKSGTTIETKHLLCYAKSLGIKSQQCVAITDAGSALEHEANYENFLHCFVNPGDIGGRFSALSFFGLVPAYLCGLSIPKIFTHAQRMINLCQTGRSLKPCPDVGSGSSGSFIKEVCLQNEGHHVQKHGNICILVGTIARREFWKGKKGYSSFFFYG
ncbi:MAG: hypothetical protein R3A11_01130 [Bdellovibrionota bacterium]